MALVRIGLASLEMDSVSHARVSADRDDEKTKFAMFLKVSVTFCVKNFALLITDDSCLFIPSEDYAYNFVQWQIGVGSMWSEAIGLAPLKDRCLVRNNFGPTSVRTTL